MAGIAAPNQGDAGGVTLTPVDPDDQGTLECSGFPSVMVAPPPTKPAHSMPGGPNGAGETTRHRFATCSNVLLGAVHERLSRCDHRPTRAGCCPHTIGGAGASRAERKRRDGGDGWVARMRASRSVEQIRDALRVQARETCPARRLHAGLRL